MGRERNKINPELILALLQSKGIWRGANVCLIFDLYILTFCDLKYYKGAKCNCIFFPY